MKTLAKSAIALPVLGVLVAGIVVWRKLAATPHWHEAGQIRDPWPRWDA